MTPAFAVPGAEPLSKPFYTKVALALLGFLLIVTTARFSGYGLRASHENTATDFHVFYLVSRLVWQGQTDQAYHSDYMFRLFAEFTGRELFFPWSYPPQHSLLVAPLSILPLGAAYLAFTAGTLVAYLAILHRLAGSNFTPVLLSILPALIITIACGQNGFLTGTLIGLTCVGLLRFRWSAGLPLGVLVIKPHLAVGLALFTLLTCRWRVAWTAALIVVITSAAATLMFEVTIWASFLGALRETRIFLDLGAYPLHHMVSIYSTLRSFGVPAAVALGCHALFAIFGLSLIYQAARRGVVLNQQLGLAILGGLLVSPYVCGYDLSIYGVALALLLPDLLRRASEREQAAVFGLSFFTCAWGLAMTAVIEWEFGPYAPLDTAQPIALGGVTLAILVLLVWRILGRADPVRREHSAATPCAVS